MVRIGKIAWYLSVFQVKNILKGCYRDEFGLFPAKSALDLTAKKIFKTASIVKKCGGLFPWYLFQLKKMVKKGYYGNKGLGLTWDRIKVGYSIDFMPKRSEFRV